MTIREVVECFEYGRAYSADEAYEAVVSKGVLPPEEARGAVLTMMLAGYLDLGRDRLLRRRNIYWGGVQE